MTPMHVCRWCGTYVAMMWDLCGDDMLIGNALETYVPMWEPHVHVSECAFPCWEVHNIPTCPLLGTHVPMLRNIVYTHMGTPCFLSKKLCSIVGEHWTLQVEIFLFPHSQHVCSHVGNYQWEHGNKLRAPIK
jgi:hypothetical protein